MPIKRKNDDIGLISYEHSFSAHLQRFLRLVKTREIAIKASPRDCLAWMEDLVGHPPEDIEILVETQAIKRPYQFGARLTATSRQLEMGTVIGDVAINPSNPNRSIITLRFYRNIGSIIEIIFRIGLALGFCGYMSFQGISSINNPTRDGFMQCISICFGALGVGSTIAFLWMWYFRPKVDVITAHLLKLNSMTEDAIRASLTKT